MRQVLQLAVSLLLLSAAGWAGDGTRPGYEAQWQAHLRNGFSIQHCSHEIVGPSARLWLTPGKSYVDVATDEIVGFEAIEIRHKQVKYKDVRMELLHHLKCLLTITGRALYLEIILRSEQKRQRFTQYCVIIRNHDPGFLRVKVRHK